MAISRIIESGITPEQYDQMRSRLGMTDSTPPGASLHLAAKGDDGKIRIVEIWDSREEAEAWTEKVNAARKEAGVGAPPSITYFEVHNLRQA
jgi:heme-degrading monooxygenase HmoA